MKRIKGIFIDPFGKNKKKKEDFFEIKEYDDRKEFILKAKNIPSDGNFIIGSDQEYKVNIKEGYRPEMQATITASGISMDTGKYFEIGHIDGKYQVLEGNPPRKLSITIPSENLYIITEHLDKNLKEKYNKGEE